MVLDLYFCLGCGLRCVVFGWDWDIVFWREGVDVRAEELAGWEVELRDGGGCI